MVRFLQGFFPRALAENDIFRKSPPKMPKKTLMSRQSSMAKQFVSFHWEVADCPKN